MKNLINYYYNLIITEFRKIDDRFVFKIDNYKYDFIPFDGDMNILYKVYSMLINNKKYCHEILVNKDNSLLTLYNNKNYILIKQHIDCDRYVDFNDIISYDSIVYEANEINWKELWKNKIDYYEYQINQFGFKYKILRDSFSYYVGLSETAIMLLNFVDFKNIKLYFSHRRINYKEKLDNFLNPVNIIIDSRTRDIAEYIKTNYINESITMDDVFMYLNIVNFDYNESILFLSRLIYPSFYFDIYDNIIQEKISEEKVIPLIKKNVYYETFLKNVYKYVRSVYQIPEIEWLEI